MSVSTYEQVHKIEIFEVWVDGQLTDRSEPFTISELLELAKSHKLPTTISYKRRVYPKDYQRKTEVDDCVTQFLHENRIVYRPYIPDNDPRKLAYFYLQAYAFSFELLNCPSLYETVHNLPTKETKEIASSAADTPEEPLPTHTFVLKVVPFTDPLLHLPEKLNKIASFWALKLNKWDKAFRAGGYKKRVHHDVIVTHDHFTAQYRRLKEKYNHWVEEWQETTDPQKFVFEDVGIAAFLIALWELEEQEQKLAIRPDPSSSSDGTQSENSNAQIPRKRPTFIDVGCGNGFLVYLLTMEGFEGRGIDIQKRKIWARYPDSVKLSEEAIDPPNQVFEEDWILANHSDELTPWVPFMASKSNSRFFLLPCCEWSFDAKFAMRVRGLSRYESYLEWVRELTAESGYKVETEHLRIPSTRNISIVGRTRTIDPTNPADLQRVIDQQAACLAKANYKQFAPRTAPPKVHGAPKKREHKPKNKGTLHPAKLAAEAAAKELAEKEEALKNGSGSAGEPMEANAMECDENNGKNDVLPDDAAIEECDAKCCS